ncbi:Copper homeostasis CutC domain [Trinorchestia longiramus]|nr:Copper homeostasis CutC domain [Trinorchestia longiramus]
MSEVEVCVDSLESCVGAAGGGCSRVELCAALTEGGLTPSTAFLRAAKQLVSVPVFCMVRCRGGSLVFSEDESKLMVAEAEDLVAAGADGIVFGAINEKGDIDEDLCLRIKKVQHQNGTASERYSIRMVQHQNAQVLVDVSFFIDGPEYNAISPSCNEVFCFGHHQFGFVFAEDQASSTTSDHTESVTANQSQDLHNFCDHTITYLNRSKDLVSPRSGV